MIEVTRVSNRRGKGFDYKPPTIITQCTDCKQKAKFPTFLIVEKKDKISCLRCGGKVEPVEKLVPKF